ncbi:hypothetical protein ACIFOC_01022 [Leucobacter aridicollis]|uniref:phosphotransferase family protein n=1 Tax=Leucobacter aridicollis TaxID=283878 RepID=UPI0037C81C8A
MTGPETNAEVVATIADAAGFTMPPLLILDRVAAFLDEHGIGEGDISWRRIGDGQSNVTYLIDRGQTRVVLRRGPRPPLPKSTHDMVREATVQQGLARVGAPVPRILAVCADPDVLGVPFYVMEYLDGVILLDETPAAFDTTRARRGASEALVDTLVEFHTLDLDRAGLTEFGRPDGYLERQVKTFTGLAAQVSQRELPLVAEVGAWLERRRPASQRAALVHGDYRFGNVMFQPEGPPRVLAVLDWEMATLGDPLADLGYLTATYSDPASPRTVMELTSATREPGYLTRDQLAERYAAGTGLDISDLEWYQALALWKASVFLEAIYTRWRAGERPGDTFAHTLEVAVPEILERAQELTR